MPAKQKLYVFDVDGTITKNDSFLLLIKFVCPGILNRSVLWMKCLLLLPKVILKKDISVIKYHILKLLFKGVSRSDLNKTGDMFYKKVLGENVLPKAATYIAELRKEEVKIVFLSASCEFWLKPLAADYGASLICSRLEFYNDNFTGTVLGENCKGEEKRRRLTAVFPADKYEFICFGNSESDRKLAPISEAYYHNHFA